jgi:hypothetical protein
MMVIHFVMIDGAAVLQSGCNIIIIMQNGTREAQDLRVIFNMHDERAIPSR